MIQRGSEIDPIAFSEKLRKPLPLQLWLRLMETSSSQNHKNINFQLWYVFD